MKTRLFRSLATHFAGLAAGGALAWVLVAAPRTKEAPPPPKHRSTTLAARFSPTVTLELERLIEDIEAGQQAADQDRGLSIREHNLRRIEEQRLARRHHDKELARLRSIAGTFAETEDLSPVLTDVLASGDHDLSRALFLEWHRRNPDAAFDALAERSAWLGSIDDALTLAIANDQLLAQVARDDRPASFRRHLARQLGARLGSTDDLPGLGRALDDLADYDDFQLFHGFMHEFIESWVPDRGKEAARFVGLEMKPDHQRAFLEALAEPRRLSSPLPWTEDLADALFAYDLHVSRAVFEELRNKAGRLDRDVWSLATPAATPITSDMDSSAAIDAMLRALDDPLHRERDYPELFAAGEIDIDALLPVAEAAIPGAAHFPEALRRALFLKLAAHNPARAITWAHSAIPRARLDQDIHRFFEDALEANLFPRTDVAEELSVWSPGFEPRTRQLANLAAILSPSHAPDTEASPVFSNLHADFEAWSHLAPDAAGTALNRIPPDHPVWSISHPETAGP